MEQELIGLSRLGKIPFWCKLGRKGGEIPLENPVYERALMSALSALRVVDLFEY
jgi:hypothetical protein